MRILIVTHAHLSLGLGAGQMAINLAEAFRKKGYDVTLWSPHPLPPQTKWWEQLTKMRSNLDTFIETQKQFDVIDCPPILITQVVSKSAFVIARSVQPDILYLLHSFKDHIEFTFRGIIKIPFVFLNILYQIILIIQAWRMAECILCLGSLEINWMKKWFPWWRNKLTHHFNALSQNDQEFLAKIRFQRQTFSGDSIRFLWIGRWASHKGIDTLLNFIAERSLLCPQDTFTIAGCGNNAQRDCPIQLLKTGKLKILPTFERNQLYSLLANHDVGLFTSKVEGWGLVLNEMLESGMLVLATPAGGVHDLQPFFKDMLKPFPAKSQLIPDIINNYQFSEDYYNIFTWEKITETYTELIFSKIN